MTGFKLVLSSRQVFMFQFFFWWPKFFWPPSCSCARAHTGSFGSKRCWSGGHFLGDFGSDWPRRSGLEVRLLEIFGPRGAKVVGCGRSLAALEGLDVRVVGIRRTLAVELAAVVLGGDESLLARKKNWKKKKR